MRWLPRLRLSAVRHPELSLMPSCTRVRLLRPVSIRRFLGSWTASLRLWRKDRNVRYQHASEIRTDLERLKWETDVLGQTSSNHKSYPEVCRFNDPTWPTGSPEMCGKTIRGPGGPRQSASLR